MLNQLVPKSRPILVNRFGLLRKRFLHARGLISLTPCHKIQSNRILINSLPHQHSQFINLLPKRCCSSSTSSSSAVSSNSESDVKTNDREVLIDEETLDKLYKEMDQRINEVNQFLQTEGPNRQFKTFGMVLITMVSGVIAGAYAAHFGAWFLDKIGLFIVEEEDDD